MSPTDSDNGKEKTDTPPAEKLGSIDRWEGLSARDPMEGMTECMDKFTEAFQVSARRWELIVYPTLFAFIILASYGFYLIYKLTTNVDRITGQMQTVVETMVVVSDSMTRVASNMTTITGRMDIIATEVRSQATSLNLVVGSVDRMNHSVASISGAVFKIGQDMGAMTHQMHNVSRPMNFMNSIFPW